MPPRHDGLICMIDKDIVKKAVLRREIYDIIDGDEPIRVYRGIYRKVKRLSGPNICNLAQEIKIDIRYNEDSTIGWSRWQYVEYILKYSIDNDILDRFFKIFFQKVNIDNLDCEELSVRNHVYDEIIESIISKFNDCLELYEDNIVKKNAVYQICRIDEASNESRDEENVLEKGKKIFISHYSGDTGYTEEIYDLLLAMGIDSKNIVYTSLPYTGIPLSTDIYDYLRDQFLENDLYMIFVLSKGYYNSVACLNEMGAAWVLKNKYIAILLPDMEYDKMPASCINNSKICIKLDDIKNIRYRLDELKNEIIKFFSLKELDLYVWERNRDKFINKTNKQCKVGNL